MLWHVMVGDKQVGSLDEATISGLIADGRVTGASPVWRDGMADWKPLQDTPELAGLLQTRTASPPPPPPKPAAQGPTALQGFAELDGPKVSASAKGLKGANGQLKVKGGKLIVKSTLSSGDLGYVSDLQRVVIIEKNGMKAEFVFEGGTLWTLSSSEKNALPRFAEEIKKGLPALEITQEERKESASGCVIVILLLLASIPIYAGYKSYNSYLSEHVKTWHDSKSGLTWQNPPSDVQMDLKAATAYCSSLTLDGGSGWRLPTIGELRSLIRGCPAIEVGGSCNITEGGCLSGDCRTGQPCSICETDMGPGGPDRCYWPQEMTEIKGPGKMFACRNYWSSTKSTDTDPNGPTTWTLSFESANLATRYDDETLYPICVRQGEKP